MKSFKLRFVAAFDFVEETYERSGELVIGIHVTREEGSFVVLNPTRYRLNGNDCLVVVAPQPTVAPLSIKTPRRVRTRRSSMELLGRPSTRSEPDSDLSFYLRPAAKAEKATRALIDIKLESVMDLANHIVVCGIPHSVSIFVSPLRSQRLESVVPVVFLADEEPSEAQLADMAKFEAVSFVKVTPPFSALS